MSKVYRSLLKAAFGFFIASMGVLPLHAAAVCKDLPPSKLQVYYVRANSLQEEMAAATALDGRIPADALASQHTMMLTLSTLISWFDIEHRIVPRDDGSVCDAPELVRMGFGSGQRKIVVADALAGDACVRRQMLAHEDAHAQAFDRTVDQFIDDKKPDFEQGMKALKQTPAPSAEIATARWYEGLRIILGEAKRQLIADLREASARVDDPSVLTALETACGGKIRELERRGAANP
jgi:hypothetical protein